VLASRVYPIGYRFCVNVIKILAGFGESDLVEIEGMTLTYCAAGVQSGLLGVMQISGVFT